MSRLHPEAIREVRKHRPDLDDISDWALAELSLTRLVSARLHLREVGMAFVKDGARIVIAFGDVLTAFDPPARERWRNWWRRHGH